MKALLIDFQGRMSTETMKTWLRGHMRGKVDCLFSSQYYLEVVPVGDEEMENTSRLSRRRTIRKEEFL